MFKCLGHFIKKVYSHNISSKTHLIYFFALPRNFGLNVLHSFENIAKTLSVTLEVSLSIVVLNACKNEEMKAL